MEDRDDPDPTTAQARPSALLFDQDADSGGVRVVDAAPAAADSRRVARVERTARTPRRLVPLAVGLALTLVLVLVGVAFARVRSNPVEVPGFVGRDRNAATQLAHQRGVSVHFGATQSAPDPAGTVISQSPQAGTWMHGGQVDLVLSSGPAPVTVPDVHGQNVYAASTALTNAGFVVAPVQSAYSPTAPVGSVLSQSLPAGAASPPESRVVLVISKGAAPVKLPDVHSEPYAQAASQIGQLGLQVQRIDEYSDTVDPGLVTRTVPAGNAMVPAKSTVKVYVSKGPHTVKVPDVRGDSVDSATTRLNDLGFQVDVTNNHANAKVKKQNPKQGSTVRYGTTVTLSTN
jgi:beta-lactam-binding protein with PASTA domain